MTEEIHQFLSELPRRTYTSGIIFENEVVPLFVDHLGYDSNNLYYQLTVEGDESSEGVLHTDAVIARSTDVRPWLVIEADYLDQIFMGAETLPAKYEERIITRTELHAAEYGVLISNSHLIVTDGDFCRTFVLTDISGEDVDAIIGTLEPPESLPDAPVPATTGPRPDTIDASNFELDLAAYDTALAKVESAESPNEKGDALEDLAALLFEGIPFLSIRHTNLRTATSELDLVLEFEGRDDPTLFDDFERFIPVECKNWESSIGSAELRDFKGKMDSANVDLGILISKSGISGDKGRDAVRMKKHTYDDSGQAILVIDKNDLTRIQSGANFYEMLDEKLFQLRFDS